MKYEALQGIVAFHFGRLGFPGGPTIVCYFQWATSGPGIWWTIVFGYFAFQERSGELA